jgi:hypothetical protein
MTEKDHMIVAHAFDLSKEEYLVHNLKKDAIKQNQEGANIGMGSRF